MIGAGVGVFEAESEAALALMRGIEGEKAEIGRGDPKADLDGGAIALAIEHSCGQMAEREIGDGRIERDGENAGADEGALAREFGIWSEAVESEIGFHGERSVADAAVSVGDADPQFGERRGVSVLSRAADGERRTQVV